MDRIIPFVIAIQIGYQNIEVITTASFHFHVWYWWFD